MIVEMLNEYNMMELG